MQFANGKTILSNFRSYLEQRLIEYYIKLFFIHIEFLTVKNVNKTF